MWNFKDEFWMAKCFIDFGLYTKQPAILSFFYETGYVSYSIADLPTKTKNCRQNLVCKYNILYYVLYPLFGAQKCKPEAMGVKKTSKHFYNKMCC